MSSRIASHLCAADVAACGSGGKGIRVNGFKDSAGCESCSNSVSSAALLKRRFKRISTKALIVLLTLGMTFSTTPSQLWAEGAQGIAAAVQEMQAGSGAEGADTNGDASSSGDTSAQGASGTEGSSSEAGESGDDSSDGVVSSSQTPASTEGTSSTDPASESQALSAENGIATVSSITINSVTIVDASTDSSKASFSVGDTAKAKAKARGSASGSFIEPEELNYQWVFGPAKKTTIAKCTAIDGATSETLELTSELVAQYSLGGKYLKCKVSTKDGSSSSFNSVGYLVNAASAISIKGVSLGVDSKVTAGTTLTASATDNSNNDVTSKVAWSWYSGDYASLCNTKIASATTNSFTPDATYVGKYILACANGGGSDVKSGAVRVVVAGAVELYGVTVSGAQSSGAVQAGSTLTACATKDNSATAVESTDTVSYQWQCSTKKSSSDSDFTDISGATDKTYVVDEGMRGKYIRVVATSGDSVVKSTQKNYYGDTQSVDPVGPVTLEGQYKLASVAPAEETKATLGVGTVLTPSVRIPGSSSYSTSDLPSDAKLTLTWYEGDGTNWIKVTDGIDTDTGALTLDSSFVGKKLKLTAYALDNTVQWISSGLVTAEGTYDLLRVITINPQIDSSSTVLVSGDTVTAQAQAKRVDGSATNGIDVTKQASFAWYAVDAEGNEKQLEGLTTSSIQVPEAAAGKTLKVVATSGTSSVSQVSKNKVLAKDSLEGAVQQLKNAGKSLSVAYSADGANINDLLKKQLADLGYTDIDVKVKSVKFSATDANATVGISTTDDETNGNVTFFYMDPNAYTGFNFDGLRCATVTFELSRDGETVKYEPSKTAEIAWDEIALQKLLDDTAKNLAITYSTGDSAESVTQNVTLPYRAGSANKFGVTWDSSDADHVFVSGYGYGNYTGKVTRASSDRNVTLTATVKLVSGNDDISATAEFPVTVKGDPDKIAADTKALQAKVNAAFTYDSVTYSGTTTVADKDGLTADLQMPRPATIGVDGKYYQVSYSASTDDVTFNGYKGTVYQPEPNASAKTVQLTCTVTDKSNPEVKATKTLEYKIAPQDANDLAAELALMEAAKAGYAAAILNDQDANAVTSNMHAFQKAYLDSDGKLAWAYNTTDASAASSGIVPVELEGYDDMGAQGWRLFKSSDSAVVTHENLLVTQPDYSTKVTISSRLTSEKYARYAERYPDNETYAKLANQEVSATVTVKGTKGDVNPVVNVTCSVFGIDADGNQQVWAAADSFTLKNGSTAADVSEALFERAGLTVSHSKSARGWSLDSVTSPFDSSQTLAYNASTYQYWQLFINGKASDSMADGVTLNEGDSIVWAYSCYGDAAPTNQLKVTCEVVGADASGNQQTWAQPTTVSVETGSTAAELSEQIFKQAGIKADTGTGFWGWYLNSLTSPTDPDVVLSTKQVDESTWEYWQFFVNGELASVGAGNYTLKAGDTVSWVYGSDGTLPGHVRASVEVIGVNEKGKAERWASQSIDLIEGSTAADLSEALFAVAGIEADYGMGSWGWSLNSITHNGKTYAWDQATGKYWQLYVNGASSMSMASGITLKAGDKIVWAYSAYGDEQPDPDAKDPDPDEGDDWSGEWNGYGDSGSGSATTEALTPQGNAAAAWTFDYSSYGYSASEPVIANGYVFIAAGKKLLKIDYATGKVAASTDLVASIGYTTRPILVNGYVVVPLAGGRVQAVSAKTMETAWSTEALSENAQASCTVAADKVDGEWYINVSTVDVDYASGSYNNGYFVRLKFADGSIAWTHHEESEGYYWDGAASTGDYLVTSTSAGTLQVLSKATGELVSSVKLGAVVNSDPVVSEDGSTVYLLSRDGKLHVVALGEDGKLGSDTVVDTGLTGCACAPTLVDGKLIVGGVTSDASALAIIDLATNKTQLITNSDGQAMPAGFGGIKSVPLVSKQADGTYVYFTVNDAETTDYVTYTSGGGVYRYKLGDEQATQIYDAAGHNNYCDSPVVCDKYGNLYYINDSGTLFKLSSGLVVLFDSQGGSEVAAVRVLSNGCVTKPEDPTRDGYTFAGWYTNAACAKAWDFATAVTENMTLYAKWEKKDDSGKDDSDKDDDGKKDDTDKKDDADKKDDSTKENSDKQNNANNSTSVVKKTVSLLGALSSNASSAKGEEAADSSAAHASLLNGFTSKDASSDADDTANEVARTKVAAEVSSAARELPIWPFIGMAAGVLALIIVVLFRRKKDEEEGK